MLDIQVSIQSTVSCQLHGPLTLVLQLVSQIQSVNIIARKQMLKVLQNAHVIILLITG